MKKMILPLLLISFQIYANSTELFDKSYQKQILDEINRYRINHHLAELTLDETISKEATQHSTDMALNKVSFGHAGFDNRMINIFKQWQQHYGIAENVAMSPFDAKSVVTMWLDSSGHRKNIEGNFNYTGIGLAHDQQGYIYITQIFLLAEKDR